jgi:hypothetical protein
VPFFAEATEDRPATAKQVANKFGKKTRAINCGGKASQPQVSGLIGKEATKDVAVLQTAGRC